MGRPNVPSRFHHVFHLGPRRELLVFWVENTHIHTCVCPGGEWGAAQHAGGWEGFRRAAAARVSSESAPGVSSELNLVRIESLETPVTERSYVLGGPLAARDAH